jgi:hypothetical protein
MLGSYLSKSIHPHAKSIHPHVIIHLLALLYFTGLSGCSGGGSSGGVQANVNPPAQYSAVPRNYGDAWKQSVSNTTDAGVQTTSSVDYAVDAVHGDGSYSLSLYTEGTQTITTELRAADSMRLVTQGCMFSPEQSVFPFPLYVGKTWTQSFAEDCTDENQATVTGSVTGEKTVTTPAGSFHALEIAYTTTLVGDDPQGPVTSHTTCSWATDLGINVQCDTSTTFAGPASASIVSSSSQLQSVAMKIGSKVPGPVSAVYPAFLPSVPQVGPPQSGWPIADLRIPKLVPVFFSDTPLQSRYLDFIDKYAVSSAWSVLGEYGVGAASVGNAILLPEAAPVSTTGAAISNWIRTQAPSWAGIDANSFVIIFYPASTSIALSGNASVSCQDFGAYHDFVALSNGIELPYAVVPDCKNGLGAVTAAASHEIAEGATDPLLTGYYSVTADASWGAPYGASEIGDMCTRRSDNRIYPADIGYPISKVWSNRAAQAYQDPCLPTASSPAASLYFNSAPVLPDLVDIDVGGATGVAKGIVIAPGGNKTIDVQLFSNVPSQGVWHVLASQTDKNITDLTRLQFSWDRTIGQNGDVLHLTISVPPAALPNGATFAVRSYYGGIVTYWMGAVANAAAP